jgi:hypothetical protein
MKYTKVTKDREIDIVKLKPFVLFVTFVVKERHQSFRVF